jgi:glutaredoxin-related protein
MGKRYFICGYDSCSFHERAVAGAEGLKKEGHLDLQVEDGSRTWYFKRLEALKQLFPDNPEVQAWKTSPFVYVEEGGQRQFIGGCDEFMQQMSTQFPKSEGVKAAQNMMVWRDGTWTK